MRSFFDRLPTSDSRIFPKPRTEIVIPSATARSGFSQGSPSIAALPAAINSPARLREIRNPEETTQSSRKEGSVPEIVSVRSSGGENASVGRACSFTFVRPTSVNSRSRWSEISFVTKKSQKPSCTQISPTQLRSMPNPISAPKKSRWVGLSPL